MHTLMIFMLNYGLTGIKRATQAPIAIALHHAGISMLEERVLDRLEDTFTDSKYGSMMCATRPMGIFYQSFSTAQYGQMNDSASTDHDHGFADAEKSAHSMAQSSSTSSSALDYPNLDTCHGPFEEQSGLRHVPWERSLLQTALLLRMSTMSPGECVASGADESSAFTNHKYVSQLQHELVIGVDAAMTARAAAGKPVDLVQLMAWLEPLLYRQVK